MKIFTKTNKLIQYLSQYKSESIGFVPTMGALHNGHISLIKRSVEENDITIVSIFVNPTQFLEGEDLDKYPKKIEADKKVCSFAGVDILFIPTKEEIYFEDELSFIAPKTKGFILEGYHRPGHFNGVLQVVLKLLNITKPTNAYFGKKDAQQLYLVKKMIKELFLNINIVECEIVRDESALALSSRNEYLTSAEKERAKSIPNSLKKATELISKGELSSEKIKKEIAKTLIEVKVEYIEIVDRDFNKLEQIELGNTIILVAAYVGTTRLIDNIWI
jgi:pantoate--beta-alanine ligase